MTRVATLTIRNVPQRLIDRLTALAKRQNVSMAQVVRNLLEEYVGGRSPVLKEIEDSWKRQAHRPTAEEIDAWIVAGRYD